MLVSLKLCNKTVEKQSKTGNRKQLPWQSKETVGDIDRDQNQIGRSKFLLQAFLSPLRTSNWQNRIGIHLTKEKAERVPAPVSLFKHII